MKLIFVHGWSVTNTNTYGGLPSVLAQESAQKGVELDIQHIFLGKYISFHDEVTLNDISRAMDSALRELPGNSNSLIQDFACITHSTGGPVVRNWVHNYYHSKKKSNIPLTHLVMLAPANHGSALAALGKARVGRIKAWWSNTEPGQKVLDWLCLGSDGQWKLNVDSMHSSTLGPYSFVLTGDAIDNKFYDFLNNYLVEQGSDGVVRVSAANMNYQHIVLEQQADQVVRQKPKTSPFRVLSNRTQDSVPLRVYRKYSHSGNKMGIMASVESSNLDNPVVNDILECLRVSNKAEYKSCAAEFEVKTTQDQKDRNRSCMIVFDVRDNEGNQIDKDDYDLYILAGRTFRPDLLPKDFFIDRQMNSDTGRLVYYLDANKMNEIKDGIFGLRVVARPSSGFSHYRAGEFRSNGLKAEEVFLPNQTTYIEVILHRFVDKNVFRFEHATDKPGSFKNTKVSGRRVD